MTQSTKVILYYTSIHVVLVVDDQEFGAHDWHCTVKYNKDHELVHVIHITNEPHLLSATAFIIGEKDQTKNIRLIHKQLSSVLI